MSTSDTSVYRQIVVEAPVERAFSVFVGQFGRIKPPEHNMLPVALADTVLEPRVGGRVYDRGVDGSEYHWARVLAYEPPHRLMISWDFTPQFQIETDASRTSEVEIRFVAETPARTRVELEHRHLERHGEGWEGMRAAVDSADGWQEYLERFAALLSGELAPVDAG
jgi:uncharacterized protein YndB with AHSA1/START domain